MKKRFGALLLIGLYFIAASRVHAQSYVYDTGNPTFSTTIPIENGFINVNNGEIHMEFPIATHAQRGSLQLNERLVYDSRIWKIVHNSGYSWQPTNVPNSMGGWRFSSGLDAGSTTYGIATQTASTCDDGTAVTQVNYSGFQWTDPSGTQHVFTGITHGYGTHPRSCVVYPSPTTFGNAVDGSGLTMSVDNYTHMTIWDSRNVQVYPTVIDTSGNYFAKDTNGNLIDTLGRTPVTTTASGNHIYYDVLGYNGVLQRYTVTTQTVSYNTHFSQQAVSESSGSFTAIQSIALPDGSSYSFTYDSGTGSGNYGELKSVTLPSGGTINYTYQNFLDSFQNQNRWLYTRVKDGGTLTLAPSVVSSCSGNTACQEKTIVKSPALDDTVYTFSLPTGASNQAGKSWLVGIDAYQGSSTSGGTKLKGTNTVYTYNTATIPNGPTYNLPATITNTTTLYDVGLAQQIVTTMDSTGSKPTSIAEWDYFASSGSAPATPTRQTNYQYFAQSIPSSVTVVDGTGNQLSQTAYTYNETTGAGHAALQATTGLPNHGTSARGPTNLTTVANWINTSGATLTLAATYDDAGTVLSSTDPNGTTTFGRDSTDTYTTSITPPTPSSGVSLVATFGVDVNTGLSTVQTDPNQTQTVPQGYDDFGRPTEVDTLQSGVIYAKSTYSYSSNQSVKHVYQNAGVFSDTETLYDSYGRLSRSAIANGQGTNPWYQSDTCYDTNGRVGFQSYAYQGIGWSSPKVCSGSGDLYTYDSLNRVKLITHGDGSTTNYSYTGRATKVVDENGVTRITQQDALGRLMAVCEVSSTTLQGASPSSCGLDIAGTGFKTTYSYVLATHTTTITQGAQTRVSQTDSLGRSILQKEPESVQTNFSYSYNATGLVVTRKRPKTGQTNPAVLATTTTQYDSVGRVVHISYDDGTPNKTFSYDTSAGWSDIAQSNLAGRLSIASVPGASTVYSYDALGRPIDLDECLPSGCGTVGYNRKLHYSYDWSGNAKSSTDGGTVTSSYAVSRANELLAMTSSLINSTNPANLVSNIINGPKGVISYSLGNGLAQLTDYDQMGHISDAWLCNSGNLSIGCTGGTQVYGYWVSWSGGRVTSTNDQALGQASSYGYDEFNRLTSRSVTYGPVQNFSWGYDRYGNRWTQSASPSGPQPSLSFNPANNRISNAGYVYDAAGNLANDGFHTYHYDAEGNLNLVDGGTTATYVYDALNHRVQTNIGGVVTEFVFNASGQRVSVWSGSSHTQYRGQYYWGSKPVAYYVVGNAIHFQHQDWLGTERVRTNYSGAVDASFTSLPFGDLQTTATGTDGDAYHFAGLDEEIETGTDHAQSRQYSSTQGRWMSSDPYGGSYDYSNPQSFNRYSYVMNNPLGLADPAGLDGGGATTCLTGNLYLCVGVVALDLIVSDLLGLFDPSFNGSLKPRPNSTGDPNWDGNFGESLGISRKIPQGNWGIAASLGLPDAGCEFGACGAGPGFQNGLAQAKGLVRDYTSTLGSFLYDSLFFNYTSPKRAFGTRYCGPGGGGDRSGHVNSLCAVHDDCFTNTGMSWLANVGLAKATPDQLRAAKACNEDLYYGVRQYPNEPGSQSIQLWLRYGDKYGILAPGTAINPNIN